MTDFKQLGLPSSLVAILEKLGITAPKPVQTETIPIALEGRDILASAQTGTGKTFAYLLPLIAKLLAAPGTSLILAPTRELAMQVHKTLNQLLDKAGSFKTALLIGGTSMSKQIADLRRQPRIIVGTPGRVNDHLERRSLVLKTNKFLVLDEADRMLDMGFGIQLDRIAEYLPEERQTLMFSATMPPNIDKLSKKYLKNPARVTIDTTLQADPKIKQESLSISTNDKLPELLKQLNERQGSVIIFVRTKRKADTLARDLRQGGHNAEAMHGDLSQKRREQVIFSFRSSKSRILVATDVAARGLDIPHVLHVINFDLPECAEDYVHRIGRTGRADAEGFALSFISREENYKWKEICKLMKMPFTGSDEKGPKRSSRPTSRGQRPQRSFGPRRFGAPAGGQKSFGREDRPAFGDSPSPKSFGRRDRPAFGDSPSPKSFGRRDRPAFGDSPSPKSFGRRDRPAFGDSPSPKSFGRRDRPAFGDSPSPKSFGRSERPAFGDSPAPKSFGRKDKPWQPNKPFDKKVWVKKPHRKGSFKGNLQTSANRD